MNLSLSNTKDADKSVIACSPLCIHEYSPSPSSTKNDTPSSMTNTANSSSNNPTPNPIPLSTLPNTTNIIKIESTLPMLRPVIRPVLNTSMNANINVRIPRIPLPNMMPKFMNDLPPLPQQYMPRKMSLKMEARIQSSPEYSEIKSAFNHNLRVKREYSKGEQPITDVSFDECYIFSMRCPYSECSHVFHSMTDYQTHHINKHQKRDKKGKLIQTKAAKWTCPECEKVSASWYNYAAHVTMHKDTTQCDAPWICKLPSINKKKFVQWTDGTLICGKKCSTKHNLIKHLKALHTRHRIIDLSQSVKAQSHKSQKSRSPRKRLRKKRPNFGGSYRANNAFTEPPKKKIKTDPNTNPTLPIFSTGDNIQNWSNTANTRGRAQNKKRKSAVAEQGNFLGLLLEAAQLIETENKSMPASVPMCLLSSIKSIYESTPQTLSDPLSMEQFTQLLSVKAIMDLLQLQKEEIHSTHSNNHSNNINISHITNISCVPLPNNITDNNRVMPNISILPNMPPIYGEISPITPTNPTISLPKLPLPPLPAPMHSTNGNDLDSLLRLLNEPKPQTQRATLIPIQSYNPPSHFPQMPLLPNISENENIERINILPITQSPMRGREVISNNKF